jgi:hypothetical protein
MNDHRFDEVVRSFAGRRPRRAFVGRLLGGSMALLATRLRLPGAAARQQYSVQGEPCTDDSQCIGAEILFCAYNGFGSAGAACCAPVGGSCFDSAGCCGPATCYSGQCWDFSAPAEGEACWQLPGDPDPCVVNGLICTHDMQSGRIWGACQPLFDVPESVGEWCGDHFCESWQRCCSQCSGICAPRDAVCGEGDCRSGYACPEDCYADNWCPGCLSGYCLYDGACA